MPIRVRLLRTHWRHWGRYSGIIRYAAYLDSTRYRFEDQAVSHADDGVRVPRRIQQWMRAHFHRRRMPWYHVSDFSAEARAGIHFATRRMDILHYLDPEHGMQYLPLVSHLLPRRPRLVATFHQPLHTLRDVVRRDVIRRLDHAILVAPEQLPLFEDCLPPDRVSVILHGIDTDFFHPPAARPRGSTWTCLTVGHNLRDFVALRAVAERLRDRKDIRFQVVAPPGFGLDDLENVSMHSGISDEELRAMYQAADVLLLPLTNATANNALLEGLACGLPVVTTDLPAVRTYAPGDEAIRVDENRPDVLIDAVLALGNDCGLRQKMQLAARRRAEELSWSVIAPVYDRLYRDLVAL